MDKIIYIFIFSLLFSKEIYYLDLFLVYKFLVLKGKVEEKEILAEFDSLVFLISLPSSNIKFYASLPKDYRAKYTFYNYFLTSVSSLKIFFKTKEEKELVALISRRDFRVPYFEKLLLDGIINNCQFEKLTTYVFLKKSFKKKIVFEVCKQIREREV